MTINILIADIFEGLLPNNIVSYTSMFTKLFDQERNDIEYKIYDVYKKEFPKELHKDQLYLIPGSRAGAYENKEWIKELIVFIRRAHHESVPLIGVCFGHQVIAQALGGVVQPSGKGWGTGIRQSIIIDDNALKYFPSGTMQLLYNHNDQVIKLPPEATSFATSNFCENEGFSIGNHILTFQGHPEYTVEYNRYLITQHADSEPPALKETALKSLDIMENMGKDAAKWILDINSTTSQL